MVRSAKQNNKDRQQEEIMQMRYLKYPKSTNGKEEKVADLNTVLQQEMDKTIICTFAALFKRMLQVGSLK